MLPSLLLLAVPALCIAQDAPTNASTSDLVRLGAQQLHDGHYAEAEEYFRKAAEASPDLAEVHLDLGLVLVREGKVEEATKELETAARLGPQLQGVHMFLGISYYQMHRLDDAVEALQQEVALNNQNAEALMWLGVVELAAGNPEKAVGPLDRAAELSPKDLNILDYRGQAHSLVAKDSYAQMYRLAPGSWHVHRLRAELYGEQERHREAISEYLEAIREQPQNADLYEALGREYRKIDQLDMAHQAYETELKLSPRNAVAMYNLGSIDIERDDAKDGVPLLQDVVRFYDNAPVAKYYLGRGLAALGRNQEAIRYLEEAVKAEPSGEIAKRSYYELSRVYRKSGRLTDSQQALSQYLKLKAQMDKQNAMQIEDWTKLTEASSVPETTKEPNP